MGEWRRVDLRRRLLASALAAACLPRNAPAAAPAPAAGRAMPEPPPELKAGLDGAPVRLSGAGTLRHWGLHIYDARLWTGPGFDPSRPVQAPLALELIYARTLQGALIAQRSIEEMRRAGPLDETQARDWLAFMNGAFPDVGAGDRITGIWQPVPARSSFLVNGGRPQGLDDAAFGPRFFGIWLAPSTSQPALRRQLLGGPV